MTRRIGVLVGLALLLRSAGVEAQTPNLFPPVRPPAGTHLPPQLLAILPLFDSDAEGHRIDATTKTILEEAIRSESGGILGPWNYTILTSDNMLSILTDNGIDPNKACEASCALQAAREMKAQVFVSGAVGLTEGMYTAILRLFEAKTGRQLGFVVLEGASVRDLRKEFVKKARDFFAQLMVVPEGSEAETGRNSLPEGAMHAESESNPTLHGLGLASVIVGGAILVAGAILGGVEYAAAGSYKDHVPPASGTTAAAASAINTGASVGLGFMVGGAAIGGTGGVLMGVFP
jgi:hypothetical protein